MDELFKIVIKVCAQSRKDRSFTKVLNAIKTGLKAAGYDKYVSEEGLEFRVRTKEEGLHYHHPKLVTVSYSHYSLKKEEREEQKLVMAKVQAILQGIGQITASHLRNPH